MKDKRREKILELINEKDIFTQEELTGLLISEGFKVTQATVSRDIRALKLIKTHKDGKQKYAPSIAGSEYADGRILRIFREGVTSVDCAGNIVVIKTLSGMANAVCTGIDSLEDADILGTVAGDDTIICVVRSNEKALSLISEIKSDIN